MWRHFLSGDCLPLRATALYKVKLTVYTTFRPSAATSRWLPAKWRHFWVTSGHLRSRDVISCYVTASPCELQPCRKWNSQYTRVFCLLQPLPGDFRWNDVTSGSLPVTWRHVTSFSVTWRPFPVSYGLVGSETQYTRVFGLLQPLSGDFRRSRDIISCHVTASPYLPQPC